MTLQQIRYILEIARCGSISQAAKELLLTQPYLSNMLKDLESELHITIFERTRKGVRLTDEGKSFLSNAKPMIDHEKYLLEMYSRKKRDIPFNFTISLQHYPFAIEAFFHFFQKCSPKRFSVHIRECCMEQVISDVFEQRSELGIIFISNSTENFVRKYLSSRSLEFNEIIELMPYVFFRKDHPMASMDTICLEEMLAYPFASFESLDNVSLDFSEEAIFPNFSAVNRHYYVTDRATMINILSHTDSFSIGSGILSYGFAGPELVSRPVSDATDTMRLGYIQMANTAISDNGLSFIDSLKTTLKNDMRASSGFTLPSRK